MFGKGGWSVAERLGLACAIGLSLTWCIASLWLPFGWDHGFFAAVGDVVTRGGMPYRDGWEVKGPLAYYGYALAQWVFGRHMWGARIIDLLLLLAGSFSLMRMVARLASPTTGFWTALGFILWYASLTWFFTCQPDGWVTMFMLLGAGSLIAQPGQPALRRLALCGVLVGCCALIKPFYASFLLVPLVYVFSLRQPVSSQRLALSVVTTCVAAGVPLLLMTGWFVYQGALQELVQVHLLYNTQIYSGVTSLGASGVTSLGFFESSREFLEYAFISIFRAKVAIVLPAILVGACWLWRKRPAVGLSLVTWAAVAVFCVVLQGKFYVSHWIPAFAPFAVLAGFGLWTLMTFRSSDAFPALSKLPSRAARAFAVTAAVMTLAQLAITPAFDVARWLKLMSGGTAGEEYYRSYERTKYVAGDNMQAAGYIRSRTGDQDEVAIWGNEAIITFLSGRQSPTRFVYSMPLTYGGPSAIRSAYRREYIYQLRRRRPIYIIVGMPWEYPHDKEKSLVEFPELVQLIGSRYRLETQIGFLDLYRLIAGPRTASDEKRSGAAA